MNNVRQDQEPPEAIARWGWRYHHTGIPTDTRRAGEQYIERLKIHVAGYQSSPFGIQWMRFDSDCPVPEIVRRIPHVAFEVDDLDAALEGKTLLCAVNSPSEGVRVAMIIDDGAPVELLEFAKESGSAGPKASKKTGASHHRRAKRR